MCIVSMVHDHFKKEFEPFKRWPQAPFEPYEPYIPMPGPPSPIPYAPNQLAPQIVAPGEVEKVRQLIKDFREAVEMALKLDVLTKQPDCIDPEKAQLEKRVAELERIVKSLEARP